MFIINKLDIKLASIDSKNVFCGLSNISQIVP